MSEPNPVLGRESPILKRRLQPPVSEGLLLAASPILAYAVALQFEKGFAAHFKYPASIIRIDFGDVLSTWLWILAAAVLLFANVLYLSALLPSRPVRIFLMAGWRFVIWSVLLVYYFKPPIDRFFAAMFALLVFMELWAAFINPLRSRELAGSVLDRIEQAAIERWRKEASSKPTRYSTIYDATIDHPKFGWPFAVGFLLSILVALVLGIPESLGSLQARRTTDFLVLDGTPARIVVRRYGDNLVALELDSAGVTAIPRIRFLTIAGDTSHVYHMQHFPDLRIAERPPNDGRLLARHSIASSSDTVRVKAPTDTTPKVDSLARPHL